MTEREAPTLNDLMRLPPVSLIAFAISCARGATEAAKAHLGDDALIIEDAILSVQESIDMHPDILASKKLLESLAAAAIASFEAGRLASEYRAVSFLAPNPALSEGYFQRSISETTTSARYALDASLLANVGTTEKITKIRLACRLAEEIAMRAKTDALSSFGQSSAPTSYSPGWAAAAGAADSTAKAIKRRATEKFWQFFHNHLQVYNDESFDKKCKLLISDFGQVSLELIAYFSKHPEELHYLHWRKYEEILEAIFRNQGFYTEIGPGRGDGGVDLRLLQKDTIGEVVTLVQAKKYKPGNPISLEAVQSLFAVVEDQRANRGLFVTTSRYLPSAERFAERQNHKLVLARSEDVARWCKSVVERRK